MTITATEFKAKCLAILDEVQAGGTTVTITKRGKIVARLVPASAPDDKPWLRLRGSVLKYDRPFEPAVDEADVEALK
jgi:prevent-host-death family protein